MDNRSCSSGNQFLDGNYLKSNFGTCLHDPHVSGVPVPGVESRRGCDSFYEVSHQKARGASLDDFVGSNCLATDIGACHDMCQAFDYGVYLCPIGYSQVHTIDAPAAVERAACFDSMLSGGVLRSAHFGPSVFSVSRELKCTNGKLAPSVPLVSYRDRAEANPARQEIAAAEMLTKCISELDRGIPAETTDAAADLNAVMASGECLNFGHFASALELSKDVRSPYADTLLRQWLNVQGFVAEQSRIQWEAANVLAA
ncbi:MAG: hypothetical protein EOP21_10380, partial [Hyphomicrobiales bacterium]